MSFAALGGGVAASTAQGYFNRKSASKAHDRSLELLNRQQGFSKLMFDEQTNLANTAHQRAVADMKKAGINPLMATGLPSAVTPSAASAGGGSGSQAAPIQTSNLAMDLAQFGKLKTARQLDMAKTTEALAKAKQALGLGKTANVVGDVAEDVARTVRGNATTAKHVSGWLDNVSENLGRRVSDFFNQRSKRNLEYKKRVRSYDIYNQQRLKSR